MSEQPPTELAEAPQKKLRVVDDSAFDNLLDSAKFDQLWRVGKAFASSTMVPEQFQGNESNCFIACQMAVRLGVDPLMFMQSSYIVHNKPGIESKLAIALANRSGAFDGRIRYVLDGEGDDRQCTAFAKDALTGAKVEHTVSVAQAKKAGWWSNKVWQNLTDLMLQYRSAMYLIRTHCPEAIMGMQSKEELVEEAMRPQATFVQNENEVTLEDLAAPRLMDEDGGTAIPSEVIDVPQNGEQEAEQEPETLPDDTPPAIIGNDEVESVGEKDESIVVDPEVASEVPPEIVELGERLDKCVNSAQVLQIKQEVLAKKTQYGELYDWAMTMVDDRAADIKPKSQRKKKAAASK